MNKGKCPICGRTGVELTEHHVVEAVAKNGDVFKTSLCRDCHDQHEKYRNHLRDNCEISIDHTKKS